MLFPYQAGSYNGVINYLYTIGRENYISVNVHSNHSEVINPLYIILQHNDDNHWSSTSGSGQWAAISFNKKIKLTITDYSIKSHTLDQCYLRSWKLEGSNDNVQWDELHRIENSDDLKELSIYLSF